MQLSSDADVGQKGGCFVRACLQGFVLSIGSLPKKRGRRARRKTTRLFCTRAVLQPTCVADFSRTQTTTFTFLNVRRRPVQQSPPHSIKRSGQAFSCAQPFFGVLRVCVCVFHGRFTSRTEGWSLVWPAFLFVSVQPANLDRPCQAGLCCRIRGWPRATCVFVCVSCSRNRFWNRVCACVCVCVFHARFA